MAYTIFYAWQSDLDQKTNRYFIKLCLEKAIQRLSQEGAEIADSPRFEIDHDTKDIPGSPSIVEAIFDKIDSSIAFIGDVSFIAQKLATEALPGKYLSNPNVLFEMGYALNALTDKRIILVINKVYGDGRYLPFDLQHRRWPISYTLDPDATKNTRDEVERQLSDSLYKALKVIIKLPDTFALTDDQEKLQLASEQLWGISNRLLVRLRMLLMRTSIATDAPASVVSFFGLDGSLTEDGPGCRLEAYDESETNYFWHNADLYAPSNFTQQGEALSIFQMLMDALLEAKNQSESFLNKYSSMHIKVSTYVTYLCNAVDNAFVILQMQRPKNASQEHCMVSVCREVRRSIDFVHNARKQYHFNV
jgi:hypothetical protein